MDPVSAVPERLAPRGDGNGMTRAAALGWPGLTSARHVRGGGGRLSRHPPHHRHPRPALPHTPFSTHRAPPVHPTRLTDRSRHKKSLLGDINSSLAAFRVSPRSSRELLHSHCPSFTRDLCATPTDCRLTSPASVCWTQQLTSKRAPGVKQTRGDGSGRCLVQAARYVFYGHQHARYSSIFPWRGLRGDDKRLTFVVQSCPKAVKVSASG